MYFPITFSLLCLFLLQNINTVSSELISEIAKKAFDLELNSGNFIYGNQHIADAILKMLTLFYPFQRFMIFVANDGGNIARRTDHTEWFKQNDKHVTIYITTTSNSYLGSKDCYGDISEEFKSCYPEKDKILRRIGDMCGADGGYNPESVAVRAVVRADDLGLASSLPEFAMKDEIFTCKNATSPKQRWRVAIALFQDYNKVLDEFIMVKNSENNMSFQLGTKSNIPLNIPTIIAEGRPNNFETNSLVNIPLNNLYFGIAALFGILITLICMAIITVSICFIIKYNQKKKLICLGKQYEYC
uniref:Uncharacterized protein n=1 Tax=Meloidogyne enterolobii TaxID=390850 RepID=A0A6V7XP76_MELEN|nr:unnamed protein product [Meloidogyne enterolobii]